MRIIVLYLVCCLQLLFAGSAFAQSAKVSINKNNVPISQILSDIESQTDYLFIVNNQVNVNRTVSLQANQKPVNEVLNAVFGKMDVSYKLEGSHIVLSVKETVPATPQQSMISGRITNKSGMPLIGASVIIKGTTTGMSTGADGDYSLKAERGKVLQVIYIGYQTKDVPVGTATRIDIVLDESDMVIDDVIVTALGIKREEKALSYSAQQIKTEDIATVKDANFVNALNGKIAGVTINASATGIGGATRVVMRGPKSITKDNNAFYVIDGIPIFNVNGGALENNGVYNIQPRGEGISDLNPEDIESMTVLTGPSAAALYGANAANGAIIITTKKGSAGKPQITLSNQTTFSNPLMMPRMQNEYGNLPGVYASWGNKLSAADRTNYDPRDFFRTAVNIQSSASLSVGSDKNQTYVSFANVEANGLLDNNDFEKNSVTLRNTTSFLDNKLTLDLGYSLILQRDQNMLGSGRFYNPLVSLYTYPRGESVNDMRMFETYDPLQEIYVQNWKWGLQNFDLQNPLWMINRNYQNNKKTRHMFNASLSYKVNDWFDVSGRIRADHATTDFSRRLFASTDKLFAVGDKGYYHFEKIEETQMYGDVMANINKRWGGEFTFSAHIGASITDNSYGSVGGKGALRIIPNFFSLPQIDPSGANSQNIQSRWREQSQSIFASAELGWRSTLYLTLTGRNDWASALANTSNSSFFYPSVGLSALIHEMIKMPKFLSYLKIRGSYASVGNAIPRNISIGTLRYLTMTNQYAEKTIRPVSDLKPEMTSSWEIGVNAKLFGNKVNLDVTYYSSQTKDQTFLVPISSSSLYDQMYIQSGRVDNKGWELSLGYNNEWHGFSWSSHLTASTNRNKVVELASHFYDKESDSFIDLNQIEQGGVESLQNWVTVGGTIGDLWTTSELERDENGYLYVQNDKPRVISENKKVGTTLPKWNLGFRNDFSWKGINLGVLFTARFGGIVSSVTQAALDGLGVSQATADARNAGGVPVNNGTMDAQNYYQTVGQGMVLSRYIYKADNIRLQELNLGYTLPAKWFSNKLRATVSFVGRNLWMIYCKAPFDPEITASTGTYFQGIDYFMQPSMRSLGFSVELKF